MSLCASCGAKLASDNALCSHHHIIADDWAARNRRACAFFHRGILAPLTTAEDLVVEMEDGHDPVAVVTHQDCF